MFNEDSFVREVHEELRSDQLRALWRRLGPYLVAAVILLVVGTAVWRGYVYWQTKRASEISDQFIAATAMAEDRKNSDALAALSAIEQQDHGGYTVLARMRAASIKADSGDIKGAVSDFKAVSGDTSIPQALRDAARMRAGWLLIDTAPYNEVSVEIEQMAVAGNPFRHSAREALGLSAYRNNAFAKAKEWFGEIVKDQDSPQNISARAQMLLDVIAASGKAPAAKT